MLRRSTDLAGIAIGGELSSASNRLRHQLVEWEVSLADRGKLRLAGIGFRCIIDIFASAPYGMLEVVEKIRSARPVPSDARAARLCERPHDVDEMRDDSARHHWARNLAVTFVTEHLRTRFHYQQDAGQLA